MKRVLRKGLIGMCFRVLFLSSLLVGLQGCTPVATVIIKVGAGYDEHGMEKAEVMLTQNGLHRGAERLVDHHALLTYFYGENTYAFTAMVELDQSNGLLSLKFYQFGQKEFSESAKEPIEDVIRQSKAVFGEDITVIKKVGWGNI